MPSKQRTHAHPVVWLRRLCQTLFLFLFLYLFLQTAYHPINQTGGHVTFFFDLDPLVLIVTWIAAHTVAASLLLSLVTLMATVIFGRWFCGWVCPFGTVHNLFAAGRGGSVKTKIARGSYRDWQKAKYYLLIFLLTGTLLGSNLMGWFDPFSFFYRSLATAVFPAINSGIQSLFTWIYNVNPGVGKARLTLLSEPVYEVLRKYFLAVRQPQYYGGVLVGVLFGLVVSLNFLWTRFWCRCLCPLGALLGMVGKNPLVRIKKNPDTCNNCQLCLAGCQGGASLPNLEAWKPSECFYCWNCHSDCPSQAISMEVGVPRQEKPE